jgi:phosphotransferase system HPr (HPr) family protein
MSTSLSAGIAVTGADGLDPELSAQLTMKATQFECAVNLSHENRNANAKAVIEVMSLGVQSGGIVQIRTHGEAAQAALDAMIAVIQHYRVS